MRSADIDASATLIGRLRDAYDPAADQQRNVIYYHVCRPVSFYLTVPFLRAGLTANHVTAVRIVLAVAALALLMVGSHRAVIVGSVLYLLNWFLDFVDGNIARLEGPTEFGGFVDAVSDGLVKVLIPLAISVGLFVRPDQILAGLSTAIDPAFVLVFGAVTAMASGLKLYLWTEFSHREKMFRGRSPSGRPVPEPQAPISVAVQPKTSLRQQVDYLYRSVVDLVIILVPVFALLDILSVFLLLRFLSMVLTLPLDLLRLVGRARREFDPA